MMPLPVVWPWEERKLVQPPFSTNVVVECESNECEVYHWGDMPCVESVRLTPRRLQPRLPQAIVELGVGDHFAMALLSDGGVLGWGDSTYGELGIFPGTIIF